MNEQEELMTAEPEQKLSVLDGQARALAQQMHISYEDASAMIKTALQTQVLNELMSGDWYGKKNGLDILQERLQGIDLEELFHGFQINPLIHPKEIVDMLSARFPGLGPNAREEDCTILGPMLEETNG